MRLLRLFVLGAVTALLPLAFMLGNRPIDWPGMIAIYALLAAAALAYWWGGLLRRPD